MLQFIAKRAAGRLKSLKPQAMAAKPEKCSACYDCCAVCARVGIHVKPSRLPMNMSSEPIMNPHIVGTTMIEAIKTKVEPVRTLAMLTLFIIRAP